MFDGGWKKGVKKIRVVKNPGSRPNHQQLVKGGQKGFCQKCGEKATQTGKAGK